MKQFLAEPRTLATGAMLLLAGLILWPFLQAILWAAVLSILTYPLAVRFGRGTVRGSVVALLVSLVGLCLPLVLVGWVVSLQLDQVAFSRDAGAAQPLVQIESVIRELLAQLRIPEQTIDTMLPNDWKVVAQSLQTPAIRLLQGLGTTVLTIVFALFAQFFMVKDLDALVVWLQRLSPYSPEESRELGSRIVQSIRAVFLGTVLVAAVQGTLAGLAYQVAGVPFAALLGLVSIVLSIVPMLGAPVLYVPISVMLMALGQVVAGLGLLAFGIVVISQIDNVIKPFLVSGPAGLHPVIVLFSMLGGLVLLGPLGALIGPAVMACAQQVLEIEERRKTGAGHAA